MTDPDPRLAALAALGEPLRRRLYDLVASRREPTSRDQASEALGIPRSVAAFHLDKLAAVGLLAVDFRRPAGRSGPGAGRPTKLYRRAPGEIAFAVPERHYEVAGELLAEAVEQASETHVPVDSVLGRVARERGKALAAEWDPDGADARVQLVRLAQVLERHGYEPELTDSTLTLENCPFHALAERHRGLVCGMNLELIGGLVDEVAGSALEARLDPSPGRCCVTIQAHQAPQASRRRGVFRIKGRNTKSKTKSGETGKTKIGKTKTGKTGKEARDG